MWRTFAFDYERLAEAIVVRDRSYKLLLWISDAIDKGLIQPSRAAHHSGGPGAAIDWLEANYDSIPEGLRPARDDVGRFGAFFSTYLLSSFDIIERPGTKGAPTSGVPCSCRCELCMRIVAAPHLRAKKLRAQDKRRADELMFDSVRELAAASGQRLSEQSARRLVTDQPTRRAAAYITYGHWLIKRLEGESDGPSILALWRVVAWDPRGGMRPGFRLQLDDFLRAETALVTAIREPW